MYVFWQDTSSNVLVEWADRHSNSTYFMICTKLQPIMLKFYLFCFWAMLKKFPITLNIMPMTTAIMPQFVYNFIVFND